MEKFSVNMERIATLLEQWEQGATISTQEQELRDFFISSKEIPQEWESYKIIFCGFAALSQEKASRNYSSLGRNFGFFKTVTLYFAAAVLIAAGGFAGRGTRAGRRQRNGRFAAIFDGGAGTTGKDYRRRFFDSDAGTGQSKIFVLSGD